jgi:hypothetical protein
MMSLPIPKEIADALKGSPKMQEDIAAIRVAVERMVELAEKDHGVT